VIAFQLLRTLRRKEISSRAERALLAKRPREERAVGIETGRYIPEPEFNTLIDVCLADDTYAGLRDRAMFALAYSIIFFPILSSVLTFCPHFLQFVFSSRIVSRRVGVLLAEKI